MSFGMTSKPMPRRRLSSARISSGVHEPLIASSGWLGNTMPSRMLTTIVLRSPSFISLTASSQTFLSKFISLLAIQCRTFGFLSRHPSSRYESPAIPLGPR